MNTTPKAWYACINDCPGAYSLDAILYRCPGCGDLLEVRHDLGALGATPPDVWKKRFAERLSSAVGAHASGVWSQKEWVCPDLEDDHIVTLGEGRSPLFPAERWAEELGVRQIWVKLCGNSHTGSFKDLGMTVLVSRVKQIMARGAPIKAVACASTGDTSAALAAYCAAAGIPALVLLPKDKVSTAQLIQPMANAALTLSLDTDFDGCMEIIQKLTESKDIYLANSMNSLRVEGQKTVSLEMAQQLHWEVPEWVVVPGGNLGNISAIGKGFLEMKKIGLIDRLPRLVCAQTQRANPLYESYLSGFAEYHPKRAEPTLATAIQIGKPVSIKKAIRVLKATNGVVEQATEDELANAAARVDRHGLFTCPQTGVALAAVEKLVQKGAMTTGDRVVVVSTAHGLKFVDFKLNYHESRLAHVRPRHANLPSSLPADVDAVRRILQKNA